MNKEIEDRELLKELEKRIKQRKIALPYSVVGCYNLVIGLASGDYWIDFDKLTKEAEKIEDETKIIQRKSEMLKDFTDTDLRNEIDRRERKKIIYFNH